MIRDFMKSKYFSVFALAALLILIQYQNCSRVDFGDASSSASGSVDKTGAGSGPSIKINNGALYTNSVSVTVSISSFSTDNMYITEDSRCLSGGIWKTQTAQVPYPLSYTNAQNTIYAKFKKGTGPETACVSASILHDDKSPTIRFSDNPATYTSSAIANFIFQGIDLGSGMDYFECRLGTAAFARCDAQTSFRDLLDKTYNIEVRAVDRAGNRSNDLPLEWTVDRAPPQVTFTKTPPVISNSSTAIFEYRAEDSGSGIASVHCALDNVTKNDCTAPITNLAEGPHNFQVWAFDRSGNVSTPRTSYSWTIDQTPAGDFSILGMTSPPKDTKLDAWLTGAVPTVKWTPSQGVQSYSVSILNNSQTGTLCGPEITKSVEFAFPASCALIDGVSYWARVIATSTGGNTKKVDFGFRVDLSGPTITLKGPGSVDPTKPAEFTLSISDSNGVDSATCTKTFSGQPTSMNCKGVTSLSYSQPAGDHTLLVVATDLAGNQSQKQITWTAVPVICDPFAATSTNCQGGVEGELFYLPRDSGGNIIGKTSATSAQYIFDNGIKLNVLLKFENIFVPTRYFDKGFPVGNNFVKDDKGNTLYEFFAMRLKSVLKLDTTNTDTSKRNAPGWYQFALLSDDGSLFKLAKTATGAKEVVISNEGLHSTKLLCSAKAYYMDENSRFPVDLDYFQGPATQIAFSVLWKKVSAETPPVDADCQTAKDDNDHYFGPFPHQDIVNGVYGKKLVPNGWKPIGTTNFIRLTN